LSKKKYIIIENLSRRGIHEVGIDNLLPGTGAMVMNETSLSAMHTPALGGLLLAAIGTVGAGWLWQRLAL
jgi:hypothetical protein